MTETNFDINFYDVYFEFLLWLISYLIWLRQSLSHILTSSGGFQDALASLLESFFICKYLWWAKDIVQRIKYELTTHAACTASDTLPALGSHQKTWHWKCWFPVSIMKANVCTSLPTPMKDKKRTRHSTRASSSSSCSNSHASDLDSKLHSIKSSSLINKHIDIVYWLWMLRACIRLIDDWIMIGSTLSE